MVKLSNNIVKCFNYFVEGQHHMNGDALMDDVEIVEGQLIGTLLRIPSSVVAEATERGLAAAGYEEVRAAHLPVLQPLFSRPEGARITDLAAWARVTKPAMVYLVNHLEAHGY